jgi:hypothetical protein
MVERGHVGPTGTVRVPSKGVHVTYDRELAGGAAEISLLRPSMHHGSSLEALYRHLAGHLESESTLIEEYRTLLADPDTPASAAYLIELIVEDEERHHRLFHEMAASVGAGLYGGGGEPPEGGVPPLPVERTHRALEEVTEQFLAAERTDQRSLRALRRELRPYRSSNLWALLVELMAHDTAKHILLLNFLRDHVAHREY